MMVDGEAPPKALRVCLGGACKVWGDSVWLYLPSALPMALAAASFALLVALSAASLPLLIALLAASFT